MISDRTPFDDQALYEFQVLTLRLKQSYPSIEKVTLYWGGPLKNDPDPLIVFHMPIDTYNQWMNHDVFSQILDLDGEPPWIESPPGKARYTTNHFFDMEGEHYEFERTLYPLEADEVLSQPKKESKKDTQANVSDAEIGKIQIKSFEDTIEIKHGRKNPASVSLRSVFQKRKNCLQFNVFKKLISEGVVLTDNPNERKTVWRVEKKIRKMICDQLGFEFSPNFKCVKKTSPGVFLAAFLCRTEHDNLMPQKRGDLLDELNYLVPDDGMEPEAAFQKYCDSKPRFQDLLLYGLKMKWIDEETFKSIKYSFDSRMERAESSHKWK